MKIIPRSESLSWNNYLELLMSLQGEIESMSGQKLKIDK